MAEEGRDVRKSGFTLIELMVATIVGLTAVTSMYSLGSAMSKQFYQEQRTAVSQGTARVAIMELRRDISRAALFGSPNAELESRCEALPARLPELGGGTLPMGAFQIYPGEDDLVIDPDANNTWIRGDRLRILSSLYLTDQLLVQSVSSDGNTIVLQSGNQAYRRTFAWGQAAGPVVGANPAYLDGDLDWDLAWGTGADWNGISQKGARAFQTGSVLHIESPSGQHFFRTVFGKSDNIENEIRLTIGGAGSTPLPVGTACLPGAGEGASVAPLQWVEYAVINPFAAGDPDFMDFTGVFDTALAPGHPAAALAPMDEDDLLESNAVLVRRFLNPNNGAVLPQTTQVLAEFVANFNVGFLVDQKGTRTGNADITDLADAIGETSADETAINSAPHNVRSVLIELGIRSPMEDPSIPAASNSALNTRFDVNEDQQGSARVRHIRIEIPVMTLARRNLF
ncbi:MAG: PilW family protein [Polyangiales bacterium]